MLRHAICGHAHHEQGMAGGMAARTAVGPRRRQLRLSEVFGLLWLYSTHTVNVMYLLTACPWCAALADWTMAWRLRVSMPCF